MTDISSVYCKDTEAIYILQYVSPYSNLLDPGSVVCNKKGGLDSSVFFLKKKIFFLKPQFSQLNNHIHKEQTNKKTHN